MTPVYYVRKYPQFNSSHSWEPHYVLSEVDEEVCHTVVHFLCRGDYETLRTASDPGVSNMAIEYRRSMLVYHAARKYDLYDLEMYAKKYIKMFGESMSTFDRMKAARKIYSKLPQDEVWLPSYVNEQLRIAFSLDKNIFQREEFYHGVGKDPDFDKAVMRMIVNIYSEVLSSQVTETIPEEGVAEEGAAEEGAAEVNLEIHAEPSDTTLSFGWGKNWASGSKLGLLSRDTGNQSMEKDTNLWYSKNKAEELVGFSAPDKEIKYKKKGKNKKKKKEKVEELAEPVSELRTLSDVGLV